MRMILAKLLKAIGLVRYNILVRQTQTFPADDEISPGEMVHVVDRGIAKWACFRCPGGCGAMIPLNLNSKRRPCWSVATDWLRRPSLNPSVRQQNDCGCHFWVRHGRIDWCEGGRPKASHLLPMLDLQHLQAAPEAERKALARSASGAVIHEAGHFLAAAKLGLPTDFIVFNWSASLPRRNHAAYLHERYGRTGVRPDLAGRLQLLTAGYAAEMHVFDAGLLNRAASDLQAAAEAQEVADFEFERDSQRVAQLLYNEYDPFQPDDAAVLVNLHNVMAQLINAEGGPDDIFVIPNHRIPRRFCRLVPFWRRLRSAHESRSHAYRLVVRDRVLYGKARSGI